jgi:hypothetical protein
VNIPPLVSPFSLDQEDTDSRSPPGWRKAHSRPKRCYLDSRRERDPIRGPSSSRRWQGEDVRLFFAHPQRPVIQPPATRYSRRLTRTSRRLGASYRPQRRQSRCVRMDGWSSRFGRWSERSWTSSLNAGVPVAFLSKNYLSFRYCVLASSETLILVC